MKDVSKLTEYDINKIIKNTKTFIKFKHNPLIEIKDNLYKITPNFDQYGGFRVFVYSFQIDHEIENRAEEIDIDKDKEEYYKEYNECIKLAKCIFKQIITEFKEKLKDDKSKIQ